MTKWEEYYSSPPHPVDRTDYLKQVGHTLNGKSISGAHFQLMVDQVLRELNVQDDDVILDLCCGNGYLTKELAAGCKKVVGVDISDHLLKVATEDHCPKNAEYLLMNVMELDTSRLRLSGPYNKILLYAGLQHFGKRDLAPLLRNVLELSTRTPTIVLGFVPDRVNLSDFYDTLKRKRERVIRIVKGTELIKTWWDKKFIERVGHELGLRCEFHELDSRLQAAKYRFDVVMSVVDDGPG